MGRSLDDPNAVGGVLRVNPKATGRFPISGCKALFDCGRGKFLIFFFAPFTPFPTPDSLFPALHKQFKWATPSKFTQGS